MRTAKEKKTEGEGRKSRRTIACNGVVDRSSSALLVCLISSGENISVDPDKYPWMEWLSLLVFEFCCTKT